MKTLIALGLLAIATTAAANCDVFATCTGDRVHVRIEVFAQWGPDVVNIVLHRTTNGVCDSDVDLAQFPWPAGSHQWVIYEFDDFAISAGVSYVYYAVLIDAAGNEIQNGTPEPVTVTGCGDPPLVEGTLASDESGSYYLLDPNCDCWYETWCVDLSQLSPDIYEPLVGQVVSLSGHFQHWPMAGDCRIRAAAIHWLPLGCGHPVGASRLDWGTLKALYR